jgi:hypothetical protein
VESRRQRVGRGKWKVESGKWRMERGVAEMGLDLIKT